MAKPCYRQEACLQEGQSHNLPSGSLIWEHSEDNLVQVQPMSEISDKAPKGGVRLLKSSSWSNLASSPMTVTVCRGC